MAERKTLLIPSLLDDWFPLLQYAFTSEEWEPVLLTEDDPHLAELGLKYFHNELCYPVFLVAGQVLSALRSGRYDPARCGVLFGQAGDECRGSCGIRLLRQVLEAGRNAPTAHNNQPQRIFVLQSPEAMAKADACMGCHFHPPVLLAVAYDPAAAWNREDDGKNHGEIDATIAVTQMMLQAADLGLGTTYVGMFDPEKLTVAFPEMAGLVPIAMLPLGYPAEGAHPARLHTERKPMEQLVKYL